MTTIAYSQGEMAADTQVTEGDAFCRGVKMVRLPCGGVAGGSGDYEAVCRGLAWLAAGSKGRPPKTSEFEILAKFGDGRLGSFTGKWALMPLREPAAIGSGMQAALAAMYHFGATAEQAVLAAASVDPSTSAPVDVYRVEPVKRRKKK